MNFIIYISTLFRLQIQTITTQMHESTSSSICPYTIETLRKDFENTQTLLVFKIINSTNNLIPKVHQTDKALKANK